MDLFEFLKPESVIVFLKSETKEDIIRELVEALPLAGEPGDREAVYEAVLEREKVMSTGIGRGVAIPHAKSDRVRGLMASVGIAEKPVSFDAIDGRPVKIFFLIVSDPRTTSPHIRALSLISRILNDHRHKTALERATSPEEVIEALRLPDGGAGS